MVGDLVLCDELRGHRGSHDLGRLGLDLFEGVALAVDLDEHLRGGRRVELGVVGPRVDVIPRELQLLFALVDRVDVPLDVILFEDAVPQRLPGQDPAADLGDVLEGRRGARVGRGIGRGERFVVGHTEDVRDLTVLTDDSVPDVHAQLEALELERVPDRDVDRECELVHQHGAVRGICHPRRGRFLLVGRGVRREHDVGGADLGGRRGHEAADQQGAGDHCGEGDQPRVLDVHEVEPFVVVWTVENR